MSDPNCLHCHLGKAIEAWYADRNEDYLKPNEITHIAGSLAQVLGDTLRHVPERVRTAAITALAEVIVARAWAHGADAPLVPSEPGSLH